MGTDELGRDNFLEHSMERGSRSGAPTEHNILQTKVERFFQIDFLSPVIASAFLFDVPSALVPQLRFRPRPC